MARPDVQRPRVLVIRTDSAAGLVCTLPLLRALREGHPSAWIGVLTTGALAPLLANHPDVSEALVLPGGTGGGLIGPVRLTLALRLRRLDDVVVADAAPARRVAALANRLGAQRVLDAPVAGQRVHETERVLAFGESFGMQPRPRAARLYTAAGELMRIRAGLAARSRDLQRPLVGVHVGSGAGAERWPPERFAELMRRRYEHDGSSFILLWTPDGGAEDLATRETHTRLVGVPCLRWPVPTSPGLLAALAECDSVIAQLPDVPHLAAAVGRPVVALCGGIDVQRWRPVGVAHELARATSGALADVSVDQAFAACEVLAARVSMLAAG
jgi:ADP-heptose:LPS heptosyltransferase